MKKKFFLFALSFTIVMSGCNNNNNNKTSDEDSTQPKNKEAIADSLYDEVMDGHNIGMARFVTLQKARAEANRLIDSIDKLPAQARQAAASYKTRLDSLVVDLQRAEDAMNKWMDNFNLDSAKNDVEQRIRYLADEKVRVNQVRDAILGSLQSADTLIKSRFK
jgi:hypothetical protein